MAKKNSDAELLYNFFRGVFKFFSIAIRGLYEMFSVLFRLFNKKNNNKNSKEVVSLTKNDINKKEKMSDYEKELEERMNNLDLEDWQKDLVREGTYDPENFEEDDSSDEDDYYHEDDE